MGATVIQLFGGGTRTQVPLEYPVPSEVRVTWTSVCRTSAALK